MLERLKKKLSELEMLGLELPKDVQRSVLEEANKTEDSINLQPLRAQIRKIRELRQQQAAAEDKPAEPK